MICHQGTKFSKGLGLRLYQQEVVIKFDKIFRNVQPCFSSQFQQNLYSYRHCLGSPVALLILSNKTQIWNRILNQNQLNCLELCKNIEMLQK